MSKRTRAATWPVAALLVAAAGLWAVYGTDLEADLRGSGEGPAPTITVPSQEGPATTSPEADYYTVLGPAHVDRDPAPSEVSYCPLDSLGRAVCAYASLTASSYAAVPDERQDITVDPAGWPSANREVEIPALASVEGSRAYSGWLWNRSHLVADSLGGDAVAENLITGTRTQNVGSTQVGGQYAGGMAYTERLAREYLASQPDDSCPLYYAAEPTYVGDELVPRTVVVDIASCDGSLDQRVEVSNTANGWSIDYADGSYEQE